jgi:hypothetical protein
MLLHRNAKLGLAGRRARRPASLCARGLPTPTLSPFRQNATSGGARRGGLSLCWSEAPDRSRCRGLSQGPGLTGAKGLGWSSSRPRPVPVLLCDSAPARGRLGAHLCEALGVIEPDADGSNQLLAGRYPIRDADDARPIRKGKLGKPTEFGYVKQIAEVTPHTRPGARGFILPPVSAPGNPGENELLPQTVADVRKSGYGTSAQGLLRRSEQAQCAR